MAENLENKFVWNRKPDGRYFKNVIPNNILCQNLWILEIIWYILKFRNIWILRFSKTKTDFFFNFKCLVNEEWNGYTASDLLTNFMGEFTFCNAEEYSVKTQKQPPKVFSKISQNSQENTCRTLFSTKMHRAYNFNKKGTQLSQLFSCEFYEIFNTNFFTENLWMVLQTMCPKTKKIKLLIQGLA